MRSEEKIMLHELLGIYILELEEDIKAKEPYIKTKYEFASMLTMQNHVKVLNEVRNMIVLVF